MYRYFVKLDRVVDGDTIDIIVDLGFFISHRMRIRLQGINAPEKRGKSRKKGLKAMHFVEEQLAEAKIIAIKTHKVGKFGRYIGEVYYSKRNIKPENIFKEKYLLNSELVRRRLAKRVKY